jgi:predicted metal-dependent phosphoesterase TrpH
MRRYFDDLSAEGLDPFEEYVRAYRELKKHGEKLGLDVWFGAEVCLEKEDSREFLLYGITEDFILTNRDILDWDQRKLYEEAHKAGAIVVQSHPYRSYTSLGDLNLLDGIEAYNYHPNHTQPSDEFVAFAKSTGKIVTSASDFHFRGGENKGGMLVPNEVKTIKDFVKSLQDGTALCIIQK